LRRAAEFLRKRELSYLQTLPDRLEKQMSTYEPLPGKHINGSLTLGESIADVAGLTVAYDAYQLSLNGKPSPSLYLIEEA
jgi:putative endopeptidase